MKSFFRLLSGMLIATAAFSQTAIEWSGGQQSRSHALLRVIRIAAVWKTSRSNA